MLKCLICGKEVHSLINHSIKAHHIFKNQYKEMFNYDGPFEDQYLFQKRFIGNKNRYINHPEGLEKYRKSMQKVKETTDYLNKLKQANINRYKDENERKKTSIATKKVRSTSKSREKTRLQSKKQYLEGNSFNFIEVSKSYSYGTPLYFNDLLLRNKLEYKIARILTRLHYDYTYEELRIPYILNDVEKIHLIDFYIPKLNLIIECKYSHYINDKSVIAKMQASISQGYKYIIITEKDNIKTVKEKINNSLT